MSREDKEERSGERGEGWHGGRSVKWAIARSLSGREMERQAQVAVERQMVTCWREESVETRLGGLRSRDTRFHTSPLWLRSTENTHTHTRTCITQYMIIVCGWLWTHNRHGCACVRAHVHTANGYTGLHCFFWCLFIFFTLLLLRSSFGFLLPGGYWPSVSKAFDHGGGMKALPQNITPPIIRAVPLN